MANYMGCTRTNYFRVTDAERLKEIVDRIIWDEDGLGFFNEKNGEFAFGAYSSICGLSTDNEDDAFDSDVVYHALQDIVASDSAIIITEIGYEKLRYLVGYTMVITKNGIEYVDIWNEADIKARDLVGKGYVHSRNDY